MTGITASVEELLKLRVYASSIFISSKKKTRAAIAGAYASPFRGRGIDFSEVRVYQPGDDIRMMDWRVTARSGKPHTKLFTEERERPVFFLVDMRAAMHFGTRVAFKSVVAARSASMLAWAAVEHGDRVGGLVFDDANKTLVPFSGGSRGVTRLIRALSDYSKTPPKVETTVPVDLTQALSRIRGSIRGGSLLYVISDFRSFDPATNNTLALLAQTADVVCLHVHDVVEAAPPPPDVYWVSDGYRTSQIDTRARKNADLVQSRFQHRVNELRLYCHRHNVRWLSIATDADLLAVLRTGLRSTQLGELKTTTHES
jgi:uncharacterized protein (DUF58 family)